MSNFQSSIPTVMCSNGNRTSQISCRATGRTDHRTVARHQPWDNDMMDGFEMARSWKGLSAAQQSTTGTK